MMNRLKLVKQRRKKDKKVSLKEKDDTFLSSEKQDDKKVSHDIPSFQAVHENNK